MKKWCIILTLIGISLSIYSFSKGNTKANLIYRVKVEGVINPITERFLVNAIKKAIENKARCLIIEMDTPGGLVSSTHNIVREILNSNIPIITYISPKGARAASAGVFISLASDVIAMAPMTHIGAAHPVTMGGGGPFSGEKGTQTSDVLSDKITNDLVAHVKSIAEKKGRNVQWAEDAVRKSKSITEKEALELNVIDFIAEDLSDLIKKLDGRIIKKEEKEIKLVTKNIIPQEIKMNFREKFLHAIAEPNIAYILLMLGIYGLIYEFASPGIGLGAVCGKNNEMVKGVAPIFEDGKIRRIVVVSSTLREDFISSTQKLKESLKFYSSMNLLRVPIGEGYLVIFVFIALLMVIISFLTGHVISKRLTKPLKSLIKGLEEVGLGNLDYQVKAETKDEMARTITSFNKMVKELKENRELLVEAEREMAWRGIAQKIAHEIKGPLTPIQLSLQHLQDKFYEDPKAYENILKDCTRRISEEVDALRKMAKEFSEFARMPEVSFEYSDVNKILEDTVSFFIQVKPEVEINADYGVNLPRIRIDRERMKRVFKNIIQNGIDAMVDGGEMKIKSSADAQFLKIEFQDTGTGMDEETIKKIFTPYFSTKSHGMGLGLPIVEKIIHEHRGKIEVQSQQDKGTTFIILLPVKK